MIWSIIKWGGLAVVLLMGIGLIIGVVNDYRDMKAHLEEDEW